MSRIVELEAPGGEEPDVAFAGVDEIAARMGRETFTDAETTQVEMLLSLVASNIAAACDRDDIWASKLTRVPNMLRIVSIEAVVRVMQNPTGILREQETLGAHSRSRSFRADSSALALTAEEIRLVRRAVFGRSSSSAKVGSMLDDQLSGGEA